MQGMDFGSQISIIEWFCGSIQKRRNHRGQNSNHILARNQAHHFHSATRLTRLNGLQ